MSTQTLIIASSPFLAVFQEAANNSRCEVKQLGDSLYLSSWTWADIQPYVDTELTAEPVKAGIQYDGENEIEIPLDPANEQPQEMTAEYFRKLKTDDKTGLFYPPAVEPEPEPRYKTHMTQAEFIRGVLTKKERKAIGEKAQTDSDAFAWVMNSTVGKIWVEHPDFVEGVKLGETLGIWSEARAAEISKGLLLG